MINHVVSFQFSGTKSERHAIAAKFRDSLLELPSIIPQLHSIEVGININPAESYDLVLIARADTIDDIAAYSAHPAHLEAVKIIEGHKSARVCVDFED